MKKYLIFGDLSGHFNEFYNLVKNMAKDVVIIVLGDVPDRGRQTNQLIEYLVSHPNIIWVMGNHEHMMYHCYNHAVKKTPLCNLYSLSLWIYVNGGDETLKSYGIDVKYFIGNDKKACRDFIRKNNWQENRNFDKSETIQSIVRQFHKIPKSHIEYMEKLPLIYEDETLVATHAPVLDWKDDEFFNLEKIDDSFDEQNVLWNRQFNYKNRTDGKLHVFGHCNLPEIYAQTTRHEGGIYIDSSLTVPKDVKTMCLDVSQTGHILALEYPSLKLHKIKMT
jgi:hypothetical protein